MSMTTYLLHMFTILLTYEKNNLKKKSLNHDLILTLIIYLIIVLTMKWGFEQTNMKIKIELK